MATCASCGYHSPIPMRFCGNCGVKILEATQPITTTIDPRIEADLSHRLPPEQTLQADTTPIMERFRQAGRDAHGQRRDVTVLFADLTGYTNLSAQLDNEEVFDLIQMFIKLLINEVNKYEGFVDKLTGDGLMALFGAPISFENNAERAIRSALDMQASLAELNKQIRQQNGFELQMRIGIHAGSVIVGEIGTGQIIEYTAIGDTVNLARRIEERAAPGCVWVSEAVYRQTYRLFDFQSIPGLELKGFVKPITVYQICGQKTKLDTMRGIEGLHAPLIGRDDELKKLIDVIEDLKVHQRGHLIMLMGEAGIGKSRLTAEIKSKITPFGIRILEASSLTYRRSVSFWLLLDLIKGYLDIKSAWTEEEITQKVSHAAEKVLGKQAFRVLPYLEHFLSIKPSDESAHERIRYLDPGQLRQQIFLAVRDLLEAEAKSEPLIIILEDLHWADEASLNMLQFLLDLVSQVPIIFYLISRPFQGGTLSKIVEWANKQISEQFSTILLQNLSEAQSTNLLINLLTAPDLPEKVRFAILRRSSGIPFYIEEILRTLIDKGFLWKKDGRWHIDHNMDFTEVGVPETLQGLILARFDRLAEFQRRVLQIASVIGNQFRVDILRYLLPPGTIQELDDTLAYLEQKEYLSPVVSGSGSEYIFHHVLMSEAIYQTLLKRERSNLHGQVGEAIETVCRANITEHIELLARHYSWSNRSERALHYLILAGQKAAASFMNEQAQQHYQQAQLLLSQVSHTLEQRLQIFQGLGDILTLIGDYQTSSEHYKAALAAVEEDPNQSYLLQSILHRKIARNYERQGSYDAALNHLEQAHVCIPEDMPYMEVEDAQVLNDTGWIYFRQGKFSEAEVLLKHALKLVENSNALDAIASIYNRLGGITYNQGDWKKTAEYLRKSIAIRDSIGDIVGLANSLNNLALLEIEMGELNNALINLERSYELKKHLGQAEGLGTILNNLGWLKIQLGESKQAQDNLSDALNLAHRIGYNLLEAQALKNFGDLYLEDEQWQDAIQVLQKAIDIFTQLGAQDQLIDSYRLLGEAALRAGHLQQSKDCLMHIQNMSISLGTESRELSSVQQGELSRFRGMLAAHQGDLESSRKYLLESEQTFRTLGGRLYQGKAVMQLGLLAEARGDMYTAQHRFREAELIFRSVGAKTSEARARIAAQRQVA